MKQLWQKSSKSDRTLFIASVCLFGASLGLLGAKGQRAYADPAGDEEFYRFMDLSAEIYSNIKGRYVEDVDSREVLEAGLRGMFSVLDEHSQYMDPQVFEDLKKDTEKEYGGLGIHITQRQGLLTVIAPMPGSPAAKAGLQPWDRIVEIEGESTQKWTVRDAVEKLMGPAGTSVKLKYWREGWDEPKEVELERGNIPIRSVHGKMLENGVGYVRLSKFSENTSADLKRELLKLRAEGARGVVLDLRFNTGGLLREAIGVTNMFVEKGKTIVSTKGRMRNQNREEVAQNDPLVRLPLFVLVNGSSASASEIVAGALQDHGVATIIGPAGMNTYGKGSVQSVENLAYSLEEDADGNPLPSAMRLTTARYYTPSGRTIHQTGITPDIGIPIPAGHEGEVLEHGLLGDPENPRPKPEDEVAPAPEDGKPFWSHATKPQFEKKEYRDIILDEALERMRFLLEMEPATDPEDMARARD